MNPVSEIGGVAAGLGGLARHRGRLARRLGGLAQHSGGLAGRLLAPAALAATSSVRLPRLRPLGLVRLPALWLARLLPAIVAADDDAEVARRLLKLAVHVLPLAHPQVVQVLTAAQPAERGRRQLPLLLAEVVPECHERQEVRAGLGEAAVHRVGRFPGVGRSLAGILDRQRRGDDQHLAHAAALAGGEDHPAEARVDGQLG